VNDDTNQSSLYGKFNINMFNSGMKKSNVEEIGNLIEEIAS
jgi:hypothetical protein